jgi:transposase-like protein
VSYKPRDHALEEMVAEWHIEAARTTVTRRVRRYGPEFAGRVMIYYDRPVDTPVYR